MPSLYQIDAEGRCLQTWSLAAGRTLIGRGGRCPVSIDDRGISREHAALELYPDGRVALIDLGSSNGSLVNDLPVRRIFLRDGDTVRVGSVRLRFTESTAPDVDPDATVPDLTPLKFDSPAPVPSPPRRPREAGDKEITAKGKELLQREEASPEPGKAAPKHGGRKEGHRPHAATEGESAAGADKDRAVLRDPPTHQFRVADEARGASTDDAPAADRKQAVADDQDRGIATPATPPARILPPPPAVGSRLAPPAKRTSSDPVWTSEPVTPQTVVLGSAMADRVPPEWQTLYSKVRSLIDVIRQGPGATTASELLERVGASVLLSGAAARAALWRLPARDAKEPWELAAEVYRPSIPTHGWPAFPLDLLRTVSTRPAPSRLRASLREVAFEPASQAGGPSRPATENRKTGGVRALALPIWDNPADPLAPPAPAAPDPPRLDDTEVSPAPGPLPFRSPSPAPAHRFPVALLYFESAPGGEGLGMADEEFLLAVGRVIGSLTLQIQTLEKIERNFRVAQRTLDDQVTIVSASPAFQEILNQVDRLAASDTTVLVLGESGTGKELIARAIHRSSARRNGPLVCVNCSSLPENLVESELFGHERGAFTGAIARKRGQFEMADGGTLFLDEIGDMPLPAQAKLLRVLETGEVQRVGGERTTRVDVRVVAATNRDLEREAKESRFRDDLYYRLNVVALRLPPLRDRVQDVDVLIKYFLDALRKKIHSPLRRFSNDALLRLRSYPWPGNVRQLRNVVERALVFATDAVGGIDLLPPELNRPPSGDLDTTMPAWVAVPPPGKISGPASPTSEPGKAAGSAPPAAASPATAPPPDATPPEVLSLADIELRHIQKVLLLCDGNKQRAASLLGISRSTLYGKLKEEAPEGEEEA